MADEPSLVDQLVGAVKGFVTASSEDIAKGIGIFTTARAVMSTVASAVANAALQSTLNTVQAKYQDVPLTPAVLADMVIRNIIPAVNAPGVNAGAQPGKAPTPIDPTFDTVTEASYSGMSARRMALMAADTGESYGILDALRLYNRGQYMAELVPNPHYGAGQPLYVAGANLAPTYGITAHQLETVIYYSRVRDQFIPDLLKLSKNSLSPADAIELAVKQVVSNGVAQQLFEAAGGVGEQFAALVAASGDSMGVEKAATLHAWGLITDVQLQEILGLTRLNPRFYDLVPLLNAKRLPVYEIRTAVVAGLISQEKALEWMTQEGYDTEQSTLFLQAAAMGNIATAKAETEGMVLADWQAGLVTAAQATEALRNLGYQAWAVPFILDSAEAKRVTAQRNMVVSRVRAAVLYGDVAPTVAENYLGQLGWSTQAAQEAVNGWVIEAETPHELLSTAQVGKLLEDGVVDEAFALAYWVRRGYTPADARLLLSIYPPASKGPAGVSPEPFEPPPPGKLSPLPPPPPTVPIVKEGPSAH